MVDAIDNLDYRAGQLEGAPGIVGPPGPPGPAMVLGHVATVGDLPTTGNTVGDAWLVGTDMYVYVWNGASWDNAGSIKGNPGPTGPTGPPGPAPTGGVAYQYVAKLSGTDFDIGWVTTAPLVVKATTPTAADYGLATIPTGALWVQT